MSDQETLRNELLATLDHIAGIVGRLRAQSGMKRPFSFPDQHKLMEGVFLSALTHWEQFVRGVMIADLATVGDAELRRRVRTFRSKRASHQLAALILDHPDENRFVEWASAEQILARAASFLGGGHRFLVLQPLKEDLNRMKKVRNAIAHKSDDAWGKFRKLVRDLPFSLSPAQMKGLTAGRFLAAHHWGNAFVMEEAIDKLRNAARAVVP